MVAPLQPSCCVLQRNADESSYKHALAITLENLHIISGRYDGLAWAYDFEKKVMNIWVPQWRCGLEIFVVVDLYISWHCRMIVNVETTTKHNL